MQTANDPSVSVPETVGTAVGNWSELSANVVSVVVRIGDPGTYSRPAIVPENTTRFEGDSTKEY